MSATSGNAHQPIPSNTHINDEGLRHIYINNAIKDPEKYIGNTNPVTRATELRSLIVDYVSCKQLRSGSLLLEVKTFKQLQKVLQIRWLMKMAVQPVLALNIGTIKGFAHEPRLMDMSTDMLKTIWKDQGVIQVDRKFVVENNVETFNASLIITFKGNKLPFKLPVGDEWITVR